MPLPTARFAFFWLVSVLLALPAAAKDPTQPALGLLGTPGYPAPTLHGKLELSLADAIAMGLENNLGIEIERHDPLIAHETHITTWGAFDPMWSSELGYQDVENPNANVLLGTLVTKTTKFDGSTGLSGLVPWLGASYKIEFTGSDDRTNVTVSALSPELRSSINFLLTLPLLKGLIWGDPWTNVKKTQVLEESAWERFRKEVMDTVQRIEKAYWGVIAADERVRVAEKSLETAQALLEQVTTQYEVGVVSKVEIAEAEAGEATREFELIREQNVYQTEMDGLINEVLGPGLTADSRITIVPTDRPDEFIAYDIDVEQSAQIAFARRPELVIAQKAIDEKEINVKFAKNQRLPQLDAVLSYGNRGISGSQNPDLSGFGGVPAPPPGTLDIGGFGETFSTPGDWFTNDAARQLTARGIFTIPLGNVSGRHGVSKAQLELRRARVERRRVEQTIILEIRRAVRDLLSAQRGIEAAERGQVAAAEQLRAERIRLEYGESTPFDVLQREEQLVQAEQQYIRAFQVYRDSVTDLDRAQGTILRNRNVNIERVARLR